MIEFAQYLDYGLDYARSRTMTTLRGVTDEHAWWRPTPKSNSMLNVLFHIARQDDFTLSLFILEQPQLWVSEGWAERLGLPAPDDATALDKSPDGSWPFEIGWGFTALEDNQVKVESLMEYAERSRSLTKELLETVTLDFLAKPIDDGSPRHQGWDVGKHIGAFGLHESHHQGQMDYIKGLRYAITGETPPGRG